MQILCFIGNKKPPPRIRPWGRHALPSGLRWESHRCVALILILVAKIRIKSNNSRHYFAQFLAKLRTILLKY